MPPPAPKKTNEKEGPKPEAREKEGPPLGEKELPRYRVVGATSLLSLALEVNEQIADGYTPTGGIAVKPPDAVFGAQFVQAMVKT